LGNSAHHSIFPARSPPRLAPIIDLLGGLMEKFYPARASSLVFINGHGGNDVPGRQAVFEVRQQHRQRHDLLLLFATYWQLGAKPWKVEPALQQHQMGHADEWETSMILRLAPKLSARWIHSKRCPLAMRSSRPRAGQPKTAPCLGTWRSTRGHAERARPCSALSPTTWSRCSKASCAWDGKIMARVGATPRARPVSWKWWICGCCPPRLRHQLHDRQTLANARLRITKQFDLNRNSTGNLELVFGWAFAVGSTLFGIARRSAPGALL